MLKIVQGPSVASRYNYPVLGATAAAMPSIHKLGSTDMRLLLYTLLSAGVSSVDVFILIVAGVYNGLIKH